MSRVSHAIRIAVIAAAVGLLGACLAAVPPELIDARLMYDRANTGQTAQLAPDELARAKRALKRAESEYQRRPRGQEAKDLAYIAQRRVQIAESRARLEIARREQAQAESQLSEQQSRTAEELERLRAGEEARSRLAAEEAERARQEELSRAAREQQMQQDELARTKRQMAEQQEQLRQRQEELERERQAREAAEASQRAALENLERFAQVREEQRGTVITLPGGLLFAPGRTDLSPGARRALERVATALKAAPDQQLVIEGHTDSRGPEDFNYEVSVLRADAVKDFLAARGVERDRIQTVGFGETRPIASNTSAEGRATNRRVEIVVERGVGGAGENIR